MTIELTMANAITLVALYVASVWALLKVISMQQDKRLAERFDALGKSIAGLGDHMRTQSEGLMELEREFMRLQAELPVNYVRREDYIRGQSVIEAKLDGLASKLENAQLRAMMNGARP